MHYTTTLDGCTPGTTGTVRAVAGDSAVAQRLLALGLVADTPFRVVRFAPLGDPIEIDVLGTRISLRAAEAALVHITLDAAL